jgi:hypothetical protein
MPTSPALVMPHRCPKETPLVAKSLRHGRRGGDHDCQDAQQRASCTAQANASSPPPRWLTGRRSRRCSRRCSAVASLLTSVSPATAARSAGLHRCCTATHSRLRGARCGSGRRGFLVSIPATLLSSACGRRRARAWRPSCAPTPGVGLAVGVSIAMRARPSSRPRAPRCHHHHAHRPASPSGSRQQHCEDQASFSRSSGICRPGL